MSTKMLSVAEITPLTIQGEFPDMGKVCMILRLAGCNLSCPYCDTVHDQTSMRTVESMTEEILERGVPNLLITGGEPLLQVKALNDLLTGVKSLQSVVIETNGTLSLKGLQRRLNTRIAMDVKLHKNQWDVEMENVVFLSMQDSLKFVFWNESSLMRAFIFLKTMVKEYYMIPSSIVFSPAYTLLKGAASRTLQPLVKRILEEAVSKDYKGLDIRLQIQIHKFLKTP